MATTDQHPRTVAEEALLLAITRLVQDESALDAHRLDRLAGTVCGFLRRERDVEAFEGKPGSAAVVRRLLTHDEAIAATRPLFGRLAL